MVSLSAAFHFKRGAADLFEDMSALFREFGNDMDIRQIGFPDSWHQILMNDMTYCGKYEPLRDPRGCDERTVIPLREVD
jgi:hypothetical protein